MKAIDMYKLFWVVVIALVLLGVAATQLSAQEPEPPPPVVLSEGDETFAAWLDYFAQVSRDTDEALLAIVTSAAAGTVVTLVEGFKLILNNWGFSKTKYGKKYQFVVFVLGLITSSIIVFGMNANILATYSAKYAWLAELGEAGQLGTVTLVVWFFSMFGAEIFFAFRKLNEKARRIAGSVGEVLKE